jgi:hypothetical protein
MRDQHVDARIDDALRRLGERGELRGIDAILARAAEDTVPVAGAVVRTGGRPTGLRRVARGMAVIAAAAAGVLVAVVVVAGRSPGRIDDIGADGDRSPVATTAPATVTSAATATTVPTITQPVGCALAEPCMLPAQITDFEMRQLPDGWPAAPLPQVDRHPLVPWSAGPTIIQREYQATTKDLATPGGPMARSIIVTVFTGDGTTTGPDQAAAGETVRELPGGRRLYVTTYSMSGRYPRLDVAMVRVVLEGGRWVHLAGTGVDLDELIAIAGSIVVR